MPSVYRLIPCATIALACMARVAGAEEAVPTLDTGDTAWILTSTALEKKEVRRRTRTSVQRIKRPRGCKRKFGR